MLTSVYFFQLNKQVRDGEALQLTRDYIEAYNRKVDLSLDSLSDSESKSALKDLLQQLNRC